MLAGECGNERLRIYVMEERDIEEVRLLHNNDSTLIRLTDVSHISQESQYSWYKSISKSKTSRRYSIRLRKDDIFIGLFRIDRIDPYNRNAYVGLDIVESYRGQGYATEIYQYFFKYLFDSCGMHRLALTTMENNIAALNLYAKLGFVTEGRERQAIFREGRFWDLILMGLTVTEWREIK